MKLRNFLMVPALAILMSPLQLHADETEIGGFGVQGSVGKVKSASATIRGTVMNESWGKISLASGNIDYNAFGKDTENDIANSSFDASFNGLLGRSLRENSGSACSLYGAVGVSGRVKKDLFQKTPKGSSSKINKTAALFAISPEGGLTCRVGKVLLYLSPSIEAAHLRQNAKGKMGGGFTQGLKGRLALNDRLIIMGEVSEFKTGNESIVGTRVYRLKSDLVYDKKKKINLHLGLDNLDGDHNVTFGVSKSM